MKPTPAISCLLSETDETWVLAVMRDFDLFLQDHAACESKAMSQAMSILTRYPDDPRIVEPMFALAKEELDHYHQVYRILKKRHLTLSSKKSDDYVKALRVHIRHREEEHLLDRLLVAALIEARSAERLEKLAKHLSHNDLPYATFYARLAKTEQAHWKIFFQIAEAIYGSELATSRLRELAIAEKNCLAKLPIGPTVH